MNSRQRVRAAIERKSYDRLPRAFQASPMMGEKLMKYFGVDSIHKVNDILGNDIEYIGAPFTGKLPDSYIDTDGLKVEQVYWGYTQKYYPTAGGEFYPMNIDYPWNFAESAEEIKNVDWINPDMFDYDAIKWQCDFFDGKSLMIGGGGMYQFATFMRESSLLYMDMAAEPEIAEAIFNRFVDLELEMYERSLQAGEGQIDLLICNDDYGTQSNLLFSVPMWRRFFKKNTEKMAALAHKYNAFYVQHSCGAIRDIIPELIDCGVDVLNPIQKVPGLEPEGLKADFGKDITFYGGIDTQWLLPSASPEEVRAETARYAKILSNGGGYILSPSQILQNDVPCENIEAMFSIDSLL